jgi:hypothetical protein
MWIGPNELPHQKYLYIHMLPHPTHRPTTSKPLASHCPNNTRSAVGTTNSLLGNRPIPNYAHIIILMSTKFLVILQYIGILLNGYKTDV